MPRPVGLHSWAVIVAEGASSPSPSELLAQVIAGLDVDRGGVTDLFIGCATPVGAQAGGFGRLGVASLDGGASVPAATFDGGLLAPLLALRAARDRVLVSTDALVIAAGVEVPSIVPRGAATVRDYGRPPGPAVPEIHLAEQLAAAYDWTSEGRGVVAVDGVLAAASIAVDIDAAAAIVLGPPLPDHPTLLAVELAAGAIDDLTAAPVAAAEHALGSAGHALSDVTHVLVVDDLAVSAQVILESLGVAPAQRQSAAFCFERGTAAGADALRAVAFVARDLGPGEQALIVVRGPLGQGGAAVVAGPKYR